MARILKWDTIDYGVVIKIYICIKNYRVTNKIENKFSILICVYATVKKTGPIILVMCI